jgi:coatomer subunit beta'
LIRRIELTSLPKGVYWNESGQLVSVVSEESTFLLKHNLEAAKNPSPDDITDDGIESAFSLVDNGELNDVVKTATWVGDCFLYTNAANRLQYYVGGELVTVAHLDHPMYLLGYIPKENRVFLADRDVNVVSYSILLSVLEYQTAVMRLDFEVADSILPSIPRDLRTRVAHFLERRGFLAQALAVTTDPEHKFELALQLNELETAYELAKQDDEDGSTHKWKQLAEAASRKCNFQLAQECLSRAGDYAALLLLASCCGNGEMLHRVANAAHDQAHDNVAFLARFLQQDLEGCIQLLVSAGRLPEATLFARTYLPSRVPTLVEKWRDRLRSGSNSTIYQSSTASQAVEKLAQSIANPLQYENLFPGWRDSIKAENFLHTVDRSRLPPAHLYSQLAASGERNALLEMHTAEQKLGREFSSLSVDEQGSQPAQETQSASIQNGLTSVPKDNHISDKISFTSSAISKPAALQVLNPATQVFDPTKGATNIAGPGVNINETVLATSMQDEEDLDMDDDELERDIANLKIDANDLNWDDSEEDE